MLSDLHDAIAAVCPIRGVSSDGVIDYVRDVTTEQQKAAAVIAADWDWAADNWKPDSKRGLDASRVVIVDEIDAKTRDLITSGLKVNDETISTSETAQLNLYGMMLKRIIGMPYVPQGVSTVDGREYVIQTADDFTRIAGLMDQQKTSIQNTGRALRIRALESSDQATQDTIRAENNARG